MPTSSSRRVLWTTRKAWPRQLQLELDLNRADLAAAFHQAGLRLVFIHDLVFAREVGWAGTGEKKGVHPGLRRGDGGGGWRVGVGRKPASQEARKTWMG